MLWIIKCHHKLFPFFLLLWVFNFQGKRKVFFLLKKWVYCARFVGWKCLSDNFECRFNYCMEFIESREGRVVFLCASTLWLWISQKFLSEIYIKAIQCHLIWLQQHYNKMSRFNFFLIYDFYVLQRRSYLLNGNWSMGWLWWWWLLVGERESREKTFSLLSWYVICVLSSFG
jgi:hypothetical protein